jgi:glyoxylase-like metal-dependent hydrolase (beta-lactamase superfamily II)
MAVVVERFESALWETSSLLLSEGTEAVLVDPAVSADEVARIAERARALGVEVTHVLATHADWDGTAFRCRRLDVLASATISPRSSSPS